MVAVFLLKIAEAARAALRVKETKGACVIGPRVNISRFRGMALQVFCFALEGLATFRCLTLQLRRRQALDRGSCPSGLDLYPRYYLKSLRPPDPPGSRESFFAGPKKGTKEKTNAALAFVSAWLRCSC